MAQASTASQSYTDARQIYPGGASPLHFRPWPGPAAANWLVAIRQKLQLSNKIIHYFPANYSFFNPLSPFARPSLAHCGTTAGIPQGFPIALPPVRIRTPHVLLPPTHL